MRGALRIAFIGCGRAAVELHLPALRRVRAAEVVAAADTEEGRLAEVRRRFGGIRAYTDWRRLLAESDAGLVAVCVPAALHREVGVAVLESGRHVVVEKPLALDLGAADTMVEAARASGLFAAVGFNLRCHRLVRRAAELVRSGALGEVELLRSTWTAPELAERSWPLWRFSRSAGGGALNEVAVHHVDLWRHLLGEEVAEIQALAASDRHQDHTVSLAGRMVGGALVASAFCQRSTARNEIEVFGREGSLSMSLYRGDSLRVLRPRQQEGGAGARFGGLLRRASAVPMLVHRGLGGGDFRLSFARQWHEVVARVGRGLPPVASFEDGRQAVRIVAAAAESADTGRLVRLDQGRP